MKNRIVVGTDFSEEASIATRHAMAIAQRRESEIVLVHALAISDSNIPRYGVPYPFVVPSAYLNVVEEMRQVARKRLEETGETLSGQGVELSHAIVDDVAERGIIECINELEARLVVVGSHGRTGVGRFLLGSVAEQVVRHAPCDVLVARGDPPRGGYKRILVPTDFSPMGDLALERAVGVVEPGGEVEVLHCWHLPGGYSPEWGDSLMGLRDNIEASATSIYRKRIANFTSTDVRFKFKGFEGPVRLGIMHRAEAKDFDLIVMGSHGRTGVKRVFLGSIAEATVRHAAQSVYVARSAEVSATT